MPYGTISEETRNWIELRAAQGNVSNRFTLEPEIESPDDVTISITVEGALDEEFTVNPGMFVVNIVDWIAELLENGGITDFWITAQDNNDEILYTNEGGF